MTSKSVLREEIKDILNRLTSEEHLVKSQNVATNLWGLISDLKEDHLVGVSSYLGLFAPLTDEVDIFSLKDHLNYPCVFPYGEGQKSFAMSFRKSSFDDLEESHRFGVTIRSPKSGSEVAVPNIIVMPGLAFSSTGERLGRGKGYYDRYLESYSGIRIGVCFKEQLKSELPCDEHDQQMDYVVTESGVINCNGRE